MTAALIPVYNSARKGEMHPSSRGLLVSVLGLIGLMFSAWLAAGTRKNTIEIRPGMAGLIAYGTLMSPQDMGRTLGHKYEGKVRKVHLTGYVRGWALRRPLNDPRAGGTHASKASASIRSDGKQTPISGMINLNVIPEKNGRMNAILYVLTESEFLRLDKREVGYERRDVTGKIEEFRFGGGKVYVYEGLPDHPSTSAADPKEYVLVKEYLDQVVRACDAIGPDFRAEFDKSTRPIAYRIVSFMDIIWKNSSK